MEDGRDDLVQAWSNLNWIKAKAEVYWEGHKKLTEPLSLLSK